MKLSKRLQIVAQCVPQNARIADIGSDHAYLPSYLAINQKISFAVAGEVVQGPFESAQSTVNDLQLTQQITVRLGNGLDVIQASDKIDTVTICGMGGELIAQILERGRLNGKLDGVTTLILQPNMAEKNLRQWLMAHHYRVTQEYILKENQKIYEIIVAIPTQQELVQYTHQQLTYGVYLPLEKNDVFIEKWQAELAKLTNVLHQLEKANQDKIDKIALLKRQKSEIEEMIR